MITILKPEVIPRLSIKWQGKWHSNMYIPLRFKDRNIVSNLLLCQFTEMLELHYLSSCASLPCFFVIYCKHFEGEFHFGRENALELTFRLPTCIYSKSRVMAAFTVTTQNDLAVRLF